MVLAWLRIEKTETFLYDSFKKQNVICSQSRNVKAETEKKIRFFSNLMWYKGAEIFIDLCGLQLNVMWLDFKTIISLSQNCTC